MRRIALMTMILIATAAGVAALLYKPQPPIQSDDKTLDVVVGVTPEIPNKLVETIPATRREFAKPQRLWSEKDLPADAAPRVQEADDGLPVAIATITPNPAYMSIKGGNNFGKSILLDGSRSLSDGGITSYQWSQVGGRSLRLLSERMNKPRISLHIYNEGTYTFQLTVFVGEVESKPAFVQVKVEAR